MMGIARGRATGSILALALATGLAAGMAIDVLAEEVIVHTTDGRAIRGELVQETEGGVRIAVAGIATDLPQSRILEIVRLPDEAAGFAARRSAIADDDLPARVDLAAEMIAAGLLDAAALEIEGLRQTFPESNFPEALSGLLEAARPAEEAEATGIPGFSDPPRRLAREDLLDAMAITRIKIGEMDLANEDRRLAIHIPPIVLNELFADHAGRGDVPESQSDQSRLRRADAAVQWRLLESTRDQNLMSQVRIIGDPMVLRSFRQEVNPRYVWRYFGRYFGRGAVEGLELVLQKPNGTPEAYTNFGRLSDFRTADAAMIDRLFPEQSLLLQWGLPREVADHPAPEVPDWRPYFRGRDDPRFLRMRDWIESLANTPDYLNTTAADARANAGANAGNPSSNAGGSLSDTPRFETPPVTASGTAFPDPEPAAGDEPLSSVGTEETAETGLILPAE